MMRFTGRLFEVDPIAQQALIGVPIDAKRQPERFGCACARVGVKGVGEIG